MLLKKMEDSFSNVIQLSELMQAADDCTRSGDRDWRRCSWKSKVAAELECLRAAEDSGRDARCIRASWSGEVLIPVPVAPYTKAGDPFQFDFGYNTGTEMKLFHAVSMRAGVDSAVTLAARYPTIAPVMEKMTGAAPRLTAVVEDELNRNEAEFTLR